MDVAYGRSGAGTPGMPGSKGQHGTKRMRTSFKHQQLRTKLMRTSLKHNQLRTMNSYFAINQNPNAKNLEQLSQKTGLPKRVLQFTSWGGGGCHDPCDPPLEGVVPERAR
ncbi:protein apterous-like [Bacillus rossius redtenbacheri]|uniref:protein apterous-like n=1 Tax=Bacillus rossius redtenbacheri TaxID=93214 RepID=UPI002FDD41CC